MKDEPGRRQEHEEKNVEMIKKQNSTFILASFAPLRFIFLTVCIFLKKNQLR